MERRHAAKIEGDDVVGQRGEGMKERTGSVNDGLIPEAFFRGVGIGMNVVRSLTFFFDCCKAMMMSKTSVPIKPLWAK